MDNEQAFYAPFELEDYDSYLRKKSRNGNRN